MYGLLFRVCKKNFNTLKQYMKLDKILGVALLSKEGLIGATSRDLVQKCFSSSV